MIVLLAFCILHAFPAAAAPKVLATIKPVHALVAGVMQGVDAPQLLLTGAASPHTYALRPSQSRSLQEADLVFWIGPEMETFLVRPLRNLATKAHIVTLAQTQNMLLLPIRAPWPADETATQRTTGADDAHAGADMHIWLDPRNAAIMVREIAKRLAQADPAHSSIYQANSDAMLVRLDALERRIGAELRAARLAPYMVFHDAYRYFEARFGLNPVAIISLDAERPPGAARIRALKQKLSQTGVACIFTEPQFEPKIALRLAEGSKARIAVLDPLGAALEPGGELYFTLLTDIARNIRACAR